MIAVQNKATKSKIFLIGKRIYYFLYVYRDKRFHFSKEIFIKAGQKYILYIKGI